MPTKHTLREGESLVDIAHRRGFFAETVWNDPGNAELRAKRKSMDILMAGDELTIPDLRVKEVDGATEKRHAFKLKGIPAVFRMQIFDGEEPRKDQDYELTIRGRSFRKTYKGKTDGDGTLKASFPPDAIEGELVIGPDAFTMAIRFGHLDPINEVSGVKKRLLNLGYDCEGDPAAEVGPATKRALRAFQHRVGLPVNGELDDATRGELERMNDAVNAYPDEPTSR